MDKQMIEEMEKDIAVRMEMAKGVLGSMNNGIEGWLGKYLIEKGWAKIPENAVVFIPTEEQYVLLSKKEHEELKKGIKTYNYTAMFNSGQEERIRQLEERLCFVYEQSRKETAEKFAKLAKERKIEMGTDGHSYCMVFVEDIDEICKEITGNKV